jgi:predicted Na+-dependent transporter
MCSRPTCRPEQLDSYIAGLILLAAAPCTAMVFVWSNLCDGDPLFTLSQVALNDTDHGVRLRAHRRLLLGLSSITVPWDTLLLSVVLYIVVPVIVASSGGACCGAVARLRWTARWRGWARVDGGAAGHAGAAVRLPGRGRSSRSRW